MRLKTHHDGYDTGLRGPMAGSVRRRAEILTEILTKGGSVCSQRSFHFPSPGLRQPGNQEVQSYLKSKFVGFAFAYDRFSEDIDGEAGALSPSAAKSL